MRFVTFSLFTLLSFNLAHALDVSTGYNEKQGHIMHRHRLATFATGKHDTALVNRRRALGQIRREIFVGRMQLTVGRASKGMGEVTLLVSVGLLCSLPGADNGTTVLYGALGSLGGMAVGGAMAAGGIYLIRKGRDNLQRARLDKARYAIRYL